MRMSTVYREISKIREERSVGPKYKQEGPKGPGLLTWGKGQRSHWSHLQMTTNVVQQILVEDL